MTNQSEREDATPSREMKPDERARIRIAAKTMQLGMIIIGSMAGLFLYVFYKTGISVESGFVFVVCLVVAIRGLNIYYRGQNLLQEVDNGN